MEHALGLRTPSRSKVRKVQQQPVHPGNRFSLMSSAFSSNHDPLPQYDSNRNSLCCLPPDYADERLAFVSPNKDGKTPPASLYGESELSTPVRYRKRRLSTPRRPNPTFIEPRASYGVEDSLEFAEEDEGEDHLVSELDLLVAQTQLLLTTSSECLGGMIEAREQLKRFHALDSLLERYVSYPLILTCT